MKLVADIVIALLLLTFFILLAPLLFIAGVFIITIELLIRAYYWIAKKVICNELKGTKFSPA